MTPKDDIKKLKVLIIDDSIEVCETITEYCNILGVKSKYIVNPKELDRFLDKENFSVILLDQHFPDVKGLDILRKGWLKNVDSYIVIMTGESLHQEMINTMLKLGVNEFLKKPFNILTFQKVLFRALTFHHEISNFYMACKSLRKSEMEFCLENNLSIIGTVARMIVRNVKELGFVENLRMLETAIVEALTNAIIHGNLEIPSDIKNKGFDLFQQEIEEKLKKNKYKNRRVFVYSYLDSERFIVKITDEGNGFDWKKYEDLGKAEDISSLYGRGLYIIKSTFDEIFWNDKGNEITLIKYPLSSSVK